MSIPLGLGTPPFITTYIFVGEGNDSSGDYCWYKLEGQPAVQIPIHDRALTGYLRGIKMVGKPPHKGKGDMSIKVDFHIQADKKYCIRSGITTNFSRGVLLGFEKLMENLKALGEPISICVQPGDEAKIVFATLCNANGEIVKFEWDGEKKLAGIVNKIREHFGEEPQTMDSIKAEMNSR